MTRVVAPAAPARPDAGPAPPEASDSAWSDADSGQFRTIMRHHAKGVAVVTAGTEQPVGFCATSLISLSLDPPLVSFTVRLASASWTEMRTAEHIVVHLLADGQEELARLFSQSETAKFGPSTRWHRDSLGLPVLADVLARMLVAPVGRILVADHALVIGRVVAGRNQTGGTPLVHHGGGFGRLAPR